MRRGQRQQAETVNQIQVTAASQLAQIEAKSTQAAAQSKQSSRKLM